MKTSQSIQHHASVAAHPRAIAIIGMAGRFPGARNIKQFHHNLAEGVESITTLSDAELLREGVSPQLLTDPNYVKAAPLLEDVDQFDASFFQYSARDAQIMDPQHRLFLECAWEALENAGYAGRSDQHTIGVFGGAGGLMGSYLLSDSHVNEQLIGGAGSRELIGNDKDYLCTRVSYKLNLRGPSLTVQTACSTSLVSVHLACQSLLNAECEMALAGGVSVRVPQRVGYLYQKGAIFSPDGHCRAFDSSGEGTLFGSGVGMVLLKPLEKAIADRDHIYAVIRGSAINNDGSNKMSYWATNAQGQTEAISKALAVAEVEPETIGYVEAHGTATHLGDMIEMYALKKAFNKTPKQGFCAIGSVKTNIGHADAAAGIAGLIKAALSLEHKVLFPSLHFEQPNPRIKLANSPFYVNTTFSEWEAKPYPRRAAVNSLGIGGTNAHVILEEAPSVSSLSAPAPADAPRERPVHLLTLSAKTPKALQELAKSYHEHLRQHPTQSFADVCYTANTGRMHFEHRLALVAATREEAYEQLESFGTAQAASPLKRGDVKKNQAPRIAFLFTGQGSQYVNMGRELYETQPIFRKTVDQCDEILQPYLSKSLINILYGEESGINQTAITQPALFAIEYALAKLWQSWGVEPDVVMGHSVGEYVAACIAGVFSLEDGLKLVAERGRLMQSLPQNGTMLAVLAAEPVVTAAIASYASSRNSVRAELSIAAINGPENVVISGTRQAVQTIAQTFEMQDIRSKELVVSHAFHSPLMEPMLESFAQVVSEVRFTPPTLNLISNVTGELVTNEVTTPEYWLRHVRQPVRFADGMQTLHDLGYDVFVEIGPKPLLLGMGRRCLRATPHTPRLRGAANVGQPASRDGYGVWLPSLRPTLSQDSRKRGEWQQMLDTLAELYVRGANVDWVDFDQDHARHKVVLPTYAWQRKRYWVETQTRTEKQEILDDQNEVLQMDYRQNGHATAHLKTIVQQVQQEVANSLQINPLHLDIDTPLVELGSDSLLFMEVARAIKGTYGVKVGIRQFFEELDTVNALAAYVHQSLPPEWFSSQNGQAASSQPAISLPSAPAHPSLTSSNGARGQTTAQPPVPTAPSLTAATVSHPATPAWQGDSTLERMMSQQIQAMSELMSQNTQAMSELMSQNTQAMSELMSQQLAVLNTHRHDFSAPQQAPAKNRIASHIAQNGHLNGANAAPSPIKQSATISSEESVVQKNNSSSAFDVDSLAESSRILTPQQQVHLDALIARYMQRTRGSRGQTLRDRAILSDIRYLMGLRAEIKEMRYPIIAERSDGARFWDVDGHEYIDLSMGFGVHLLGHNPPSIMQAIQEQLRKGMQLGPQSDVAGDVAELICELTGVERVSFHNSGTEAVMTAIRLARAATGRTKIALFSGSYHGHSDATLVTEAYVNGELKSAPMASGIPQYIASDVLVLPYGAPRALELIKEHAHELAAVLVEPVQSRKPRLQPQEFLHELRTITRETGITLIFDEMITGFRAHPGGAQALFGIEADLVTYGKVIGGGMPIGIVAGKAEYLDYIDGGLAQMNQSAPKNKLSFVAGTFCRHPLTMATTRAMLKHFKEEGPALQERLNQRTAQLAETLNRYFEQEQVPIEMTHFGSLFRIAFSKNVSYLYQPLEMDLLYHHLIEKGIYFWEGRTCFLSTAHTDEDIAHIVTAVSETITEMKKGGFFPARHTKAVKKKYSLR